MFNSYYHGHKIQLRKRIWYFRDTNINVESFKNIYCGYCSQPQTKEGHDACIGVLKNVMNVCCGHGKEDEAYIQYLNGVCVRGKEALTIIKKRSEINAC